MTLTDTYLRGLKANGQIQKKSDGGGLYIHVSPTGGKLWRIAYRFEGKQKTLSLGAYPAVSLKEARQKREETKEQLAKGIDPGTYKQAVKVAIRSETTNNFEVVAREWFDKHKDSWVPNHRNKILARLEKDIFPLIGGKSIDSVTAPELLEALRRIEARGAIETSHRTLQTCGQIFRYAIATGRAKHNIASDLRDALAPVKTTNFASIKEPKAIGVLLRDLDEYHGNIGIRAALRIAPYVFVRPGELRRAEWSEFNLENAEWRIPATKMKMKEMHIVPLARQVISILEDLRQYTGSGQFLFPSLVGNSKPVTGEALLKALRRIGYDKTEMTVHGFRSMASTLLNEKGYNRDWIERQLAHGERNSIRAAYNYAEHLPERRKMMQEWADYLDELRNMKP